MAEALIHSRRRRLAVAQLFANTLEDQHIGIHAHADGQNHSGDPRQSQNSFEVANEPKQNDQVKNQRHISIDTGSTVVNQHEDQHSHHSDDGSTDTRTYRIRPQRRPDRTLFQIFHARRQRARTQDHGQVLGLLLGHVAPADFAAVADRLLDVGNLLHFIVEYHAQPVIYVGGSEVIEALSTFSGEGEAYTGLTVLVAVGLGVAQIFAADRGDP